MWAFVGNLGYLRDSEIVDERKALMRMSIAIICSWSAPTPSGGRSISRMSPTELLAHEASRVQPTTPNIIWPSWTSRIIGSAWFALVRAWGAVANIRRMSKCLLPLSSTATTRIMTSWPSWVRRARMRGFYKRLFSWMRRTCIPDTGTHEET